MNILIQFIKPTSLVLLGLFFIAGCADDAPEAVPTTRTIEEYISLNNLTPDYTASGLGYVIGNPGNNKRNLDESTVRTEVIVTSTEDRTLIDTEGEIYLNMLGQVPALREGMQLIGEGGRIILYVPYEIGWGEVGNSSIPGASDVIVEVTLTSILIDVEDYIAENNIEATPVINSEVLVLVEEQGDGNFPNVNNIVEVKYTGYLTNGDVFDENTQQGLTISLQNVIRGWREGIPMFSTGGKGKIFIPYEAAYGTAGTQNIAGRTDLIFDIELVGFN